MILADALTWTARQKPELIIDAATLTGSLLRCARRPYSGLFIRRCARVRPHQGRPRLCSTTSGACPSEPSMPS